ncbi:protein-L-isoaspartate(D-aspartate) O-methyltransferase [Gimesia maris]|jgi:protein-L-isoaspartate(D-aspartate) O-methyltransferase|uniref:Protein-L-isoaspartate O-methyltransferase n=2 Tax=Gimesia maris TaxID=122 RepID=A0ABX5YX15_9PLAN|nr:protein-L-isoaspartate(D-aspartate) O-methyltransferase [Gimesia maris]MAC53568.1 protein-L-isoaspartate(D-aspartate) O-methyltransferase [Gimesia sp.]EDL60933.1 protein-L-isoaspartate O-methyltransferase [Gimesia maris DSM 8797]QDT82353.1 Protein-L-isoaspartate O-methyltransferase [Gimesia maris]QEG20133.1 Protein-L-isoaspartate O-methyltransferase [Gimesia maris]QGQ32397.1 protein-L-isoaspartate(D-aspartate) O-methyltransferase [Gimesia maris]|tara:strand:- start:21135 stop:22358 length:1224 start_codon:yes stop_codon:yes gene_type:complete
MRQLIFLTAYLVTGFSFFVTPTPVFSQSSAYFRNQRNDMVTRYIEGEGIKNPRVLSSMRQVPRHEFVSSNLKHLAYQDLALPIGYKQTISPPYVVAYMTETIDPQPDDKVLEIGTGSGFQAAVLSALVKDVYTIEIVEGLGKKAAVRLKKLDYDNVHTRIGDGYLGWPEEAPFDKIIVTCSPEKVPQPLIDQLKEGGMLLIPLGERYQQVFHLFQKEKGELKHKRLIPTLFVPMTGRSEEKREVKPDPLKPEIVNGSFEIDANNDQKVDNWHYQRRVSRMTSQAPQGAAYLQFENETPERLSQILQGMAIDGSHVNSLEISLQLSYLNTVQGKQSYQKPGLIIHFYDSIRRNIGQAYLGPWLGSRGWHQEKKTIPIPPQTREAVIQLGLNGGTGILNVDALKIEKVN